MTDKETPRTDVGILGVIATLSAKEATGRLSIIAGANDGELSFNSGKLVDARLGHLTGFQAVNALASIRDARIRFDPSAAVPLSSSITASERLVLKQFFGIDAVDSRVEIEEATVVTSDVPAAPIPPAASYQPRSTTFYLAAFALSVLVIAVAAAAVILRNEFRERTAPAAVAVKSESVSVESASKAPVTTTTADRTDAAPDLNGKWNVVNTVDTTSYRSFQNLQIGFALSINQNGRTFTAKGQKVSENGRSLPASSRTPIQLKGTIHGDRVEATFSEQGTARSTSGRFIWKIDRAGGLMGTFATTAARSSGKSTATRL